MSFEEQFDKIINQKMNEAEFPFDEKNWDKASSMIDTNRITSSLVKSKSKYFLLLGLLFISIIGIGTFAYISIDNSTEVASIDTKNKTNSELKKSNSANVIESDYSDEKVTTNSSTEEDFIDVNNTKNQMNSVNGSNNSSFNDKSEALKKPEMDSEKSKNVVSDNSLENQTSKEINDAKNTDNVNSKEDLANGKSNTTNEKSKVKTAINALKTPVKPAQIGSASKILAVLKSKQASTDQNSEKTSNEILQSSAVISSNDSVNTAFEPMSPAAINLLSTSSENECKNLNVNFASVYDNDYYKNTKPKFHYFTIEAGDMYLLGWNTTNGKDASGFNYYAGVNYGIYIDPKSTISIGLQGYNVGNIKESFYTGSNTLYEFGSTGSYTNITTNALYYFNIPLKYTYSFTKMDKIGLGFNAGFIVGGKNTVETYKLFDGVKSNSETITNKGYYEGVNTKNFTLSAFYSRKLNKRFALNGEFIYGLSDLYLNSKTNSTKENTIGIKLGLIFTLFDK